MNRCILLALFFITLSGCGPQYGEVRGKLTIKGRPLANFKLSLLPEPVTDTEGPYTFAYTNAEGRYNLRTVEGRDGAVVGSYTVLFQDIQPMRDPPVRIPQKYQYANQTPYTGVRIEPGVNEIDFELGEDNGGTGPLRR